MCTLNFTHTCTLNVTHLSWSHKQAILGNIWTHLIDAMMRKSPVMLAMCIGLHATHAPVYVTIMNDMSVQHILARLSLKLISHQGSDLLCLLTGSVEMVTNYHWCPEMCGID